HNFCTFEGKIHNLCFKILNPPEFSRGSELLKYANCTTALSARCVFKRLLVKVSMVTTRHCSTSLSPLPPRGAELAADDRLFTLPQTRLRCSKTVQSFKTLLTPLESAEMGLRRDVNFIFEIEKMRTQSQFKNGGPFLI
ncbi:MAG: hypothetical protein AAGK28_16380, partial [Pseudomonadota bacterium]